MPDSLKDLGIVYFGNDWFAENRTSSHHIAVQLARLAPVLYVDSPGLRAPAATGRDFRKLMRKALSSLDGARRIRENLWHRTVPQLPYRRWPGVARVNREFGLWAVGKAMAGIPCKGWISWFAVPHPGFMARHLGERLCVYYCIDDYAAHPGVDPEIVGQLDDELTRSADQVFVAPPAMVEAKKALNPHTVFSPHGVDAELFGRARDERTPVPEIARRLPHPVVGFFGLLGDWIDIDLLAFMAKARPTWSFLLVGHAYADVQALRELGNVVMVGPQPYESLPGWARSFDVAVIPYRDTQQVRNANPLKLREYLATGRPVVATPNPEIERFREWIRIARTGPEFLAQIEAALEPEGAAAAERRIAAVRSMTWEARVQSSLDILGERLEGRPMAA
jgi:glycosyltransferase involved in cell wall biosynthesis